MPIDDLDPDSLDPTSDTPPPRQAGLSDRPERVGRYRILEPLGEGGFGVVYLAEQTKPVRRRVALKVIKPGMDTRAVVARFEAERQALAMMDHPCVARVLDGGTVDEGEPGAGRPYFVMELVKGLPITEHCDRHRLSINERVELFIRVCEAIQHAHTKGVIHRDLKPSNVLVEYDEATGKANPKVIDFGVAKALNQPLTEATLFTERGQMIGTPEYMSPEQAENSPQGVDTRSDVYSLGVMLYELLTGFRPFDFKGAALYEIQKLIREVEPAKPSTRVSGLAASPLSSPGPHWGADGGSGPPQAGREGAELADGDTNARSSTSLDAIVKSRRADSRSLTRTLRRDLDWVVMKCLEKDRGRRYETANEVGEDLERYLGDEPVVAGPPSVAYRISKLVKRNRGLVASVLIITVLLIGGATVSVAGWMKAAHHERQAKDALVGLVREGLQKWHGKGIEDRAAAAGLDLQVKDEDGNISFLLDSKKGEEIRQLSSFTGSIMEWLEESTLAERERADESEVLRERQLELLEDAEAAREKAEAQVAIEKVLRGQSESIRLSAQDAFALHLSRVALRRDEIERQHRELFIARNGIGVMHSQVEDIRAMLDESFYDYYIQHPTGTRLLGSGWLADYTSFIHEQPKHVQLTGYLKEMASILWEWRLLGLEDLSDPGQHIGLLRYSIKFGPNNVSGDDFVQFLHILMVPHSEAFLGRLRKSGAQSVILESAALRHIGLLINAGKFDESADELVVWIDKFTQHHKKGEYRLHLAMQACEFIAIIEEQGLEFQYDCDDLEQENTPTIDNHIVEVPNGNLNPRYIPVSKITGILRIVQINQGEAHYSTEEINITPLMGDFDIHYANKDDVSRRLGLMMKPDTRYIDANDLPGYLTRFRELLAKLGMPSAAVGMDTADFHFAGKYFDYREDGDDDLDFGAVYISNRWQRLK